MKKRRKKWRGEPYVIKNLWLVTLLQNWSIEWLESCGEEWMLRVKVRTFGVSIINGLLNVRG